MPELTRRHAWIVALVAMATMTVSYLDRAMLAVLAPSVTRALALTEAQYGVLTSAFSMAYLFATPLSGWWIDRVGARRGLVPAVVAWSAIAALHAVVPGFGVLFALRIALGVAEGPSFPGAAQTMTRVLPPRDRPRGYGVLFTGASLGAMLAPPLAGWLYQLAGWRVAFLGTAAIGLLWLPAWLVVTSSPAVRAHLDVVPAPSPAGRPSIAALMREPAVQRAFLAIVAVAPASSFIMIWGAKYLVGTFGVLQADVGHYLWLPPLLQDLGLIGFGDLAARLHGARWDATRALHLVALAMTSVGLCVLPWLDGPWSAVLVGGAAMCGAGGLYTLVTADLMRRVSPAAVSTAAGLVSGGQSLALIIASPLIGRAVDAYGSYQVAVIALGLWVIPGSLLWQLWRPSPAVSP